MHRRLFTLLLIIYSTGSFAQKNKSEIDNCVSVYPNDYYLYASKTEVSNSEYADFVNENNSVWVESKDTISLLPDSSLWMLLGDRFEALKIYYYRHPAYQNYPVVNVSKQQAELFCKWKTISLNQELRKENSRFDSVIVRLPTVDEWKYIATSGHPYYTYSWEGHQLRYPEGEKMGDFRCNFNSSKYSNAQFGDYADLTAPVVAYRANELGVYNTSGNVSEFVSDNDYAYGGHYFSSYEGVTVNSKVKGIAMPTNGFRYVVEVVKLSPSKDSGKHQLTKKDLKDFFGEYQFGNTLVSKIEIPIWLYKDFALATNRPMPQIDSIPGFKYYRFIANNYFSDPEFEDQPVFGVTPEDAEAFCVWFAEMYKTKVGEDVKIELPTASNWYDAVKVNESVLNKKGVPVDADENLLNAQSRNDSYAKFYQRKTLFLSTNRSSESPYLDLLGNVCEIVRYQNGYVIVGHSVLEKVDETGSLYTIRKLTEAPVLSGFRVVMIK